MRISARLGTLALSLLAIGAGMNTAAVAASAGGAATSHQSSATSGTATQPQPYSTADQNNTGANTTAPSNPYKSTRNGAASLNGNGNGNATGKPCAGCVGRADNKFPPGQAPNASDANAGYECDTNHGIARTNPAHTGCTSLSSGGGGVGCAPGANCSPGSCTDVTDCSTPGSCPNGTDCSTPGTCTGSADCSTVQGSRGLASSREVAANEAAAFLGSQLSGQSPPTAAFGAATGTNSSGLAFTGGDWFELICIGTGLAASGLLLTQLSRRPRRGVR